MSEQKSKHPTPEEITQWGNNLQNIASGFLPPRQVMCNCGFPEEESVYFSPCCIEDGCIIQGKNTRCMCGLTCFTILCCCPYFLTEKIGNNFYDKISPVNEGKIGCAMCIAGGDTCFFCSYKGEINCSCGITWMIYIFPCMACLCEK